MKALFILILVFVAGVWFAGRYPNKVQKAKETVKVYVNKLLS